MGVLSSRPSREIPCVSARLISELIYALAWIKNLTAQDGKSG
jgi:hypothetical protein